VGSVAVAQYADSSSGVYSSGSSVQVAFDDAIKVGKTTGMIVVVRIVVVVGSEDGVIGSEVTGSKATGSDATGPEVTGSEGEAVDACAFCWTYVGAVSEDIAGSEVSAV
jgi:hypothetical protein